MFLAALLVSWVFFLSPDLTFAVELLRSMFGFNGMGSFQNISVLYGTQTIFVMLMVVLIISTGLTEAANLKIPRHPVAAFLFGVVTVLSILHLGKAVQFVYVQF